MRGAGRTIGSVVRQWRMMRGMSLEALAARVGCAKSYLSEIENDRRAGPPGTAILRGIEVALGLPIGTLQDLAAWERTPRQIKKRMEELEHREHAVRRLVDLVSHAPAGKPGEHEIERLLAMVVPDGEARADRLTVAAALPREVPLLEMPLRCGTRRGERGVAGTHVRSPDLDDPDAFAARVAGESMMPEYREGDIVIFSPRRGVRSGMDCMVRLEPTGEMTFKRVYFQRRQTSDGVETAADEAAWVRLQALNSRYPARLVRRAEVAGMYAAVCVTRPVEGAGHGEERGGRASA